MENLPQIVIGDAVSGMEPNESVSLRWLETVGSMVVTNGVPVKVTTRPKIVADGFKYRRNIGLNEALGVLSNCLRKQKCPMYEIFWITIGSWMTTVMHSYFEALA